MKTVKRSGKTSNIYNKETTFLDKVREVEQGLSLSNEVLLREYKNLAREYEKLLKQTIKITNIGDSNQRKLVLANEKVEQQKDQLASAYKKMELLARTDPLTLLTNRRGFLEQFLYEVHRFERNGKAFSLVMGDLDDFKYFNDNFGHDCGDQLLVNISNLIKSSVRKQDVVARWGGEEFILLLPESPQEGGRIVADEIRERISGEVFVYGDNKLSLTITFGVSEFKPGLNIDTCIKRADQALYAGKRQGKNRVTVWKD